MFKFEAASIGARGKYTGLGICISYGIERLRMGSNLVHCFLCLHDHQYMIYFHIALFYYYFFHFITKYSLNRGSIDFFYESDSNDGHGYYLQTIYGVHDTCIVYIYFMDVLNSPMRPWKCYIMVYMNNFVFLLTK